MIKGALDSTLKGASKKAPSDLHKDVQEGAFEVALKGVSEVLFVGVLLNAPKCPK